MRRILLWNKEMKHNEDERSKREEQGEGGGGINESRQRHCGVCVCVPL